MKRFFYSLAFIVVLAFAIVFASRTRVSSNDLLKMNIDALMSSENPSCSASANCYADSSSVVIGTVSCTGSSRCYSGPGYVVCDGWISRCVGE